MEEIKYENIEDLFVAIKNGEHIIKSISKIVIVFENEKYYPFPIPLKKDGYDNIDALISDYKKDELFENVIRQKFFRNFDIEIDLRKFNEPLKSLEFNNFENDLDDTFAVESFVATYTENQLLIFDFLGTDFFETLTEVNLVNAYNFANKENANLYYLASLKNDTASLKLTLAIKYKTNEIRIK